MTRDIQPVKTRRRPGLPVRQDPARLTRARELSGLLQNEAARRIGCAISHLCNMEKGYASASPKMLARIAAAYDGLQGRTVTVADLMPADILPAQTPATENPAA